MPIVSIYIVGSFLTPTFSIEPTKYMKSKNPSSMRTDFLVGEGGFEPPKSVTTDLQSAPFGHSGILPYVKPTA
jgi:hypothetical protein